MRRTVTLAATLLAGWTVIAAAQQPAVLPMGPARERGASVTPAYEGWYRNDDGSFSLLIGYYNRNSKEALTIPDRPQQPDRARRSRPGPADVLRDGPPVGRVRDQGAEGLRQQGHPLDADRERRDPVGAVHAEPRLSDHAVPELGMGNEPPTLWFSCRRRQGQRAAGRHRRQLQRRRQSAGRHHLLCRRCEGEGQRRPANVATVSLHKHRGPGNVTFERARIPVPKAGEAMTASATFSAPGEYLLRVQANDESGEGGGGFQCCWTNTYVKVIIK